MKRFYKYLIAFGVAAVLCVLILWGRGLFSAKQTSEIYRYLSDGFFITGIVFCGYGLLVICSNGGTFDILMYGFLCFFGLFRKDVTKRKARTFYDYRKEKTERKRSFGYLLAVGIFFLAVAAMFVWLFTIHS